MTHVALFDDFTDTVLGHHPDYAVGLAGAAATLGKALLYCPPEYVAEQALPPDLTHVPTAGRSPGSDATKLPYSLTLDPQNVADACRDAAQRDAQVFLNCYFDENYPAWPGPPTGMVHVHSLHRPGYFAADAARRLRHAGELADYVRARAGDAIFVVNTAVGERQASRYVAASALLTLGWPTATRAETAAWFARAREAIEPDPYVLSIGSARSDKGIELLLEAMAAGPTLRVVGQQYQGVTARLAHRFPSTDVRWETGWVSRSRLFDAISGAAAVAFPYQDTFEEFGGASGALAQALVAGKPVIVSEHLADQVPDSPACSVVPASDAAAWRRAIHDAVERADELHREAAELRDHALLEHTFEGYVEQILDRCR